MTVSLRHERARLDEIELHWVAAGDPDAPLAILLHGFPEFWYGWKDLLADLGADRLAVAPDQRGYGTSGKPADVEAYTIDRLAGDVLALADRLGKERFDLVAHDWGGVVAWALAGARPDRVRSLVAINAPHPALFARERRENPAQREASAYIERLVSPGAEGALAADGFALLHAGLRTEDGGSWMDADDRVAYEAAWSEPGALTGMVHWYRAADRTPGPAAVATPVEVPTRVIWGERDRFLLPGVLDGLDDLVADLEVVRVPDAGHWIVHERPGLVGRAVRGFLDRAAEGGRSR